MAHAQSFRLGPFQFSAVGNLDVAYDSNVDDLASMESTEYQRDDFYWMSGLTLQSQPVPMRPSTTLGLSAGLAYQDYLVRDDLDIATYNVLGNFQTTHPRLKLDGQAGTTYAIESMEDRYFPGGAMRDPTLRHLASLMAFWEYRRLQLSGGVSFDSERHDYEEFWVGDQDETILSAAAMLNDIAKWRFLLSWQNTETSFVRDNRWTDETILTLGANWDLFSWGGFYYTWEKTTTEDSPGGVTEDVEITMGIQGAIPLELLRRPTITYSFGVQYEEITRPTGEDEETWKPVHTLTVADEFQISKTVLLSGDVMWSNDTDEDEVQLQYRIQLSQQLGPRASHALSFTQEPRPTLGSTTDTETTTYAYNFGVKDILFYNLGFTFGYTYEESTPLDVSGALTEKTGTLNIGVVHTRQITRKLDRNLSYAYSWEDSNFSFTGITVKHLIVYGLVYRF